jgi:hypothetical protein
MPGSGRPLMARRPSGPARAGLSGSIAALAIVVLVGMLAIPVSSLVRNGKSFWPKNWDPRLAPIAHRDEQIHALKYKHPVPVRFLSDAAFKKLVVGSASSDTAGRAEIGREAATFRALGFIGGKVDLFQVTKQADEAGVLAFYDFDKKEIVVRGTTLDVSHRATLAHELVHVLQDQHFDIRKIEKRAGEDEVRRGGSVGAMLALIEGDANRVRDAYLKALSAAERKQYDREQTAEGRAFGQATAGVPPFVQLLFAAPYELGPFTIRMLLADGGNARVNAALTGPTPTSADFVQAGLIAPPPPNLPAPVTVDGEVTAGTPESFGAFELYVMLATRGSAADALTAADAVLGGRAQGLRRDGTYCYRAALATRDVPAANFVVGRLQQWAKSAMGAFVQRDGTRVTFTACDPGSKAVGASKEKLEAAELLLGARSGIAVGIAEGGAKPEVARCVARLFALSPGAVDTLKRAGSGSLPPDETTRVRNLVQQEALTCHSNPKAGLL